MDLLDAQGRAAQLDLLLASLDHDLVLKDSTPYNVQFKGARPVFVDVGSFERMREGEPWVGYRQFCMLYLYPLLLQSLKDVPFQPWLRGRSTGSRRLQMRNLLSFRDRFRRGLFTNVFLHARLEARYADKPEQVKQEVKRVFKKELFVANVRKMRKLVERLSWDPPEDVWTAYEERNSYTDEDARRKDDFVREVAKARVEPGLGHRRQQRPLRASRPRARRRSSRSTPTRARSSCSTATCAGGRRAAS